MLKETMHEAYVGEISESRMWKCRGDRRHPELRGWLVTVLYTVMGWTRGEAAPSEMGGGRTPSSDVKATYLISKYLE